jgi:hypothetical protein
LARPKYFHSFDEESGPRDHVAKGFAARRSGVRIDEDVVDDTRDVARETLEWSAFEGPKTALAK